MTWLVVERPGISLYKPYYTAAKRTFDLAVCILTAPFLVPLAFLIAVLIRLDSPGPIFFVQERVGKGGRVFRIIKFRTMHQDIDRDSHRQFMKAFVNGKVESEKTNKVYCYS